MPKIPICFLCLFTCLIVNAQTWENLNFDNDVSGINANPVRGLIPGFSGTRNFPYSMEFFYIGLRNTMNGINDFNWDELESKLETIANEGNTAVVRFYVDYPELPIATPQFLIDQGVQMRNYSVYNNDSTESKSPDYNDPRTMNMLKNFISNFGAKYNGDPRISVVQGGLVGFWGEWHNYPLTNELGMNEVNRAVIVRSFINAFPNTKINIRQPQSSVSENNTNNLGYHDDSFIESTLGPTAWHFWPTMINQQAEEVWQEHPIGGEIYPPHQAEIWRNIPNQVGQDFEDCVNLTHATYLLNHAIFDDEVGSTTYNNAMTQSKLLGYTFYANAARLNSYSNGEINVDVRFENRGVAPFYYNWDIEFALLNETGDLVNLGTTKWDLDRILPLDEVTKNFTTSKVLEVGSYKLLMRVVNPLLELKPNAKQMRFANVEQDQDKNGWLTLTNFVYDRLSVSEFSNQPEIDIYPNPTTGKVTISIPNTTVEGVEIQLIDITGKPLKKLKSVSNETVINLGNLSSGLYFLEFTFDNGSKGVERLIKN